MSVFWPGVIIGSLIIAGCFLGYSRRDWLARTTNSVLESSYGRRAAGTFTGNRDTAKANLIIPLFGGMALGAVMVILSVIGVIGNDQAPEGPPLNPAVIVLALIGFGFGILAIIHLLTRRGRKPSRLLTAGSSTVGMLFIVAAGAVFYFSTN
ncbi:hypothetical protein [Arthrobacter sp. zg-Y895]|uniref:hypothetical protein n=1 Tax=Arthrobacter sp. zg-Y895 TaxID=2886933 RepID=UPI001D14612F|nr:hypothetical protein [Arthrobacter sp. zg-Y895]MCC3301223.1 hypothetical protein [Arthrobacter sp. zg-Y895]MCC3302470.1 hypothetical protein [Arthrobacter sp. zg-Y895]